MGPRIRVVHTTVQQGGRNIQFLEEPKDFGLVVLFHGIGELEQLAQAA
jgi:hypothetical protein